jgi:hypothetical protein
MIRICQFSALVPVVVAVMGQTAGTGRVRVPVQCYVGGAIFKGGGCRETGKE